MLNTNPDPLESAQNQLRPISPRKLAANRANALKSTGPRTSKGKEKARQNALKHGFFSCDVVNLVLDGRERVDEFTAMLSALLQEYDPQSVRERILIDEVAACCWRIRRILRYECRESWAEEDETRRNAGIQSPSEAIAASMGYDHQAVRARTFNKFSRAGLDTFVMPRAYDVDLIVRYERLLKRNLYRALYTLERIRGARQTTDASDSAPLPQPLSVRGDLLDENKF